MNGIQTFVLLSSTRVSPYVMLLV